MHYGDINKTEDLKDQDSTSTETISQTKIAHLIVIVNKITIQFRYDVVDIDKMEDISGHDSISIRCRRYLQERGQKVACIIQQIVNTIIIRYR